MQDRTYKLQAEERKLRDGSVNGYLNEVKSFIKISAISFGRSNALILYYNSFLSGWM